MKKKIFIIDDNQLTRMIAADSLRGLGWEVEAYATIGDALVAADKAPPDAALVDQVMAAGNGAELIRAWRTSPHSRLRALKIVGLTSTSGRELLQAGADICLHKPVSEAKLVAALEALGLC